MSTAVSVYGPQIFELLGYGVNKAENLTQGNYISYFFLMTFAWLLVDAVGRRTVLLGGSGVLSISFLLLALFAGLAYRSDELGIPVDAVAIPGIVVLFIATGAFGIGWLATIWLIPTEIYPTTARAQGTAVSVIIWGLANFAVTLVTPIMFNNLKYWIFLVFGATNIFAGVSTYLYCPESGGRSFEENQEFFDSAKKEKSWNVNKVDEGKFKYVPSPLSNCKRRMLTVLTSVTDTCHIQNLTEEMVRLNPYCREWRIKQLDKVLFG
jgi:MFS family permease